MGELILTAALTADVALFAHDAGKPLQMLLIRRRNPPFEGSWALPGGFVEEEETSEAAARRELAEEAGVEVQAVHYLRSFSDPGRDPRGRTVTEAYVALVAAADIRPRGGDDAAEARLFSINELPSLAFDHDRIATPAIDLMREKLERLDLGRDALPRCFTIEELASLHRAAGLAPAASAALERRVLQSGRVEKVAEGATAAEERYRFT